jgi:flagellar biosynthesis/type III secretory pathway protein FliH
MIRRLPHDVVREAAARHKVTGGSLPPAPIIDAPALADPVDTEAYRSGYAEGYEAGESDGLRDATQRMQEQEDAAHNRLQELADERDRLAVLIDSLSTAVRSHGEAMEALAIEVALASLARAFGQMQGDRQLLQRLCAQMVDEFRVKAVRVAVSVQDRPVLPERLDGLELVVEAGLARGDCRVVTERGYMESSIGQRLKAIYEVMLESLGTDRA